MSSNNETLVFVISADFGIAGTVLTRGTRMLDLLNDPETNLIELHDVEVFQMLDGQSRSHRVSEAVIPKEKMAIVALPAPKHEASERRTFARRETVAQQALVMAGGNSVQGEFHFKQRRDNAQIAFLRHASGFFPLTNASVRGHRTRPLEAPTVIVNKAHVTLFSLPRDPANERAAGHDVAASDLTPALS